MDIARGAQKHLDPEAICAGPDNDRDFSTVDCLRKPCHARSNLIDCSSVKLPAISPRPSDPIGFRSRSVYAPSIGAEAKHNEEAPKMKKLFIASALGASLIASSSYAADIVDTASSNGSFKTLVAAVQAAGLVETLKGAGPFTVFAPTDEAFAALPAGTIDDLLKPENKDKLTKILTYHVVSGKVMSADLKDGMKAATVEGAEITVDLDNGAMVNDAKVVTADVAADNGVIHVIDKVLMPPM